MLMAHSWPGNVRELENVVERAFILRSEGRIGIENLPEELTGRCGGLEQGGGHQKRPGSYGG